MTLVDAYRYTDAHVRAEPELFETLAVEYLRHYDGEFELLLSYRRRLEANERLTVPMVRATLNCMRFDARIEKMPEPSHPKDEWSSRVIVDFTEARERRRKSHRPAFIDLRTHWHMRYGISHWVTATRVHMVHPDACIRYHPHTGEFECRLHWACKTPWAMSRLDIVELLSDDEVKRLLSSTNFRTWELCGTCAIRVEATS